MTEWGARKERLGKEMDPAPPKQLAIDARRRERSEFETSLESIIRRLLRNDDVVYMAFREASRRDPYEASVAPQ